MGRVAPALFAALVLGGCSIETSGLARVGTDAGADASRDAGGDGFDAGRRDAGSDACVTCECETAVDCPAETRDEWGPCSGFSSPCDQTGTQSRDVHAWLCEGSRCVENVVVESQSCTRDVEGVLCGSATHGPWSDCTFSDDCDESGERSRSVQGMFCRGGSCASETTTETSGCSRDTGGDYCSEADGCSGRCAFGDCQTACIDCNSACPSGCSGSCSGGLGGCCKCDCS